MRLRAWPQPQCVAPRSWWRDARQVSGQSLANRLALGAGRCRRCDKPLQGLFGGQVFERGVGQNSVDQHLRIGIRALELLRAGGSDQLHSRKLRSFSEVAFQ